MGVVGLDAESCPSFVGGINTPCLLQAGVRASKAHPCVFLFDLLNFTLAMDELLCELFSNGGVRKLGFGFVQVRFLLALPVYLQRLVCGEFSIYFVMLFRILPSCENTRRGEPNVSRI